jgi:hypothetical protein
MNIFKHLYGIVKKELRKFGSELRGICSADEYWREVYERSIADPADSGWNKVIAKYLYRCCGEEERQFIDLRFFKGKSEVEVSMRISLCERACYTWCEETLKNLIGFGLDCGLLHIDESKLK